MSNTQGGHHGLYHPCKGTCSGYKQGCTEASTEELMHNPNVKKAIEVIKFYADRNNWHEVRDGSGGPFTSNTILHKDVENWRTEERPSGGQLARALLNEWGLND